MSEATISRYEQHRARCEKEATRDVIFLLQARRLVWNGHLPLDVEWDGENHIFWRKSANREMDDGVTLKQLFDEGGSEYAHESWLTQAVWLDRDEAQAWGESHHYRFEDGWRVYGVCAEGELANLLRGEASRLTDAAVELMTVAKLRGDDELPHPADDPKTWTARMQDAWSELEAAVEEEAPGRIWIEYRVAKPQENTTGRGLA